MTLDNIYELASDMGVEVDNFKMKSLKALSLPEGFIAMDLSKIETSIEEKEVLAHEMGHVATGSFYRVQSRLSSKRKCEYKANEYMINLLVPIQELQRAIKKGYFEHWELSEYFNVSDKVMVQAMEYYKEKGFTK